MTVGRGRAHQLLVFWLLVGAWPCWAAAQVVVLQTSGPPSERAALDASAAELVARLGLRLGGAGDRLATVKVEFGALESTVSVIDRDGVLASFRRVPRAGTPALTVEAVALVVQSAVEELAELDRDPLNKPPEQVSAPLSPPPVVVTPAEPPSPVLAAGGVGVELGALLAVRTFAAAAPAVFGGGVLLAVRSEGGAGWLPRGSLVVVYNGPFDVTNEAIASFQSVSLRALGGARWVSGRWAVELAAGGGVDALFPLVRSEGYIPKDHVDSWSPIVTAMLGGRFRITPTTDVFLQLTGDLDLLTRKFTVNKNGSTLTLVETWLLRPALLLGFCFDVVGPRSRS